MPTLETNLEYLATESGTIIHTEDGSCLVTEASAVKVYFGELGALEVLKDALCEFM